VPRAYKKHRKYAISGGDINGKVIVTCQEISAYANLSAPTVYSRLKSGVRDVSELCRAVTRVQPERKPKPKEVVNKLLLKKPFYDEMFRLAMRKI